MKAILATVLLTACFVIYACTTSLPTLNISIEGHVEVDGVVVDAGGVVNPSRADGGVVNPSPADAEGDAAADASENASQDGSTIVAGPGFPANLVFVADVTAPPGAWTLTVASDGALAVADGDGGLAGTRTITSDGTNSPTRVVFPLQVARPNGSAVIRVTIANVTQDFTFNVTPQTVSVDVCPAAPDGGCSPETGLDGGQGDDAGVITEGGTVTLPLPSATSTLHDGDNLLIRVVAPEPTDPSETWSCRVGTTGVVLLEWDGGTTNSVTLPVGSNAAPLEIPAVVSGSGDGVVFASIENGPTSEKHVVSGSRLLGVRTVQFLDHVALAAQNRVTVCSTMPAGSVFAGLADDAGQVVPSSATLQAAMGVCPDGYPTAAAFVWTGTRATATWSLSLDGGVGIVQSVPMLGADLNVTVTTVPGTPLWTPPHVDGGIGDAAAADAAEDGGGPADSGGPQDAGLVSVLVGVQIQRVPFGSPADGGDDGGAVLEPVANTSVTLIVPPGIMPQMASFTTDALGIGYFQLTAPAGTTSIDVVLNIGGQIQKLLSIQ